MTTRATSIIALAIAVWCSPLHSQPITVDVDVSADRHPISPLIYGLNFATPDELADLNAPINRRGGNASSRYNWQDNASNRASDWYFESLAHESAQAGGEILQFVADSRAGGAVPMITIPMIGWVARLDPGRKRLSSFSIAKYGPQTDNDWRWFPDAGNGIRLDGTPITDNDPNDASVLTDVSFQGQWVEYLQSQLAESAHGGVRYFILDNEPSIWHVTHRDVHPQGASMDEIRDRIVEYGTAIRSVEPEAILLGPEEWGWGGYFLSGFDQQWAPEHGWSEFPDREAHGGVDYLPWLLDQLRLHHEQTGERLLDIFTVHFYPQSGEFSSNTSPATQELRNRSTRSLWDPDYIDESWIGDRVMLIPRLRNWVETHYPGTKIGITEYNWGAESHMNGATAQADILGIFGREGLDLATRWTTPDPDSPVYLAFRIYRNYDGSGSEFGDLSVRTSTPDPDELSAFAALRSADSALTVMLVHKNLSATSRIELRIHGFRARSAQIWQLTAGVLERRGEVDVADGTVSLELPPQTVTLVVLENRGRKRPVARP